jgi:NADPH:quinone reductase-like Zn-dependent oxidoreductase
VAKQRGAHVIAGVRAKRKSAAGSLGVDRVVAIDDEREIAALPSGLDSVADTVDGDVIATLIPKLKPGGVLGSVLGISQAAEGKNVRVEAFMAHPDAKRLHQLASDLRDKRFTIPIARTFRLADVAEAHRLSESGDANGKILLIP